MSAVAVSTRTGEGSPRAEAVWSGHPSILSAVLEQWVWAGRSRVFRNACLWGIAFALTRDTCKGTGVEIGVEKERKEGF